MTDDILRIVYNAIKKYANDNYHMGGWDFFAESMDIESFRYMVDTHKLNSYPKAFNYFKNLCSKLHESREELHGWVS